MNIITKFNDQWRFQKTRKHVWENVSLPHSLQLEPLEVAMPFQGNSKYEKSFFAPSDWINQRVALRFEGVMQKCEVFLNSRKIGEHIGGYLPFTLELQDHLLLGKDNLLQVNVDNYDDKAVPPGKPTKGLDFLYYGGIYRNVYLEVTPLLFLSDPVSAEVVQGGGLLIQTESIGKDSAQVKVKATITNLTGKSQDFTAVLRIMFEDKFVAEYSQQVKGKEKTIFVSHTFTVDKPQLWCCDSPNLYKLECSLDWNGSASLYEESFGIRTVTVNEKGFYLNGEVVYLYGVNRHQQYPYIGNAASDSAQRREARLLKSMGINTLRLAHYPQSPAFLDECDRVGLLVIDPIPGWQFCTRGKFKKRLIENVHHMVRRDRNHPSVVIFEVSPNETPHYMPGASDKFFLKLKEAAKAELPTCLTSGDSAGRKKPEKIDYDVPHTGEGSSTGAKRTLTREYGDWGFGGNCSSSRVQRADNEYGELLQAWNFQWNHNANRLTGRLLGDLVWEGIDHNRGYFPKAPISTSGVLDVFRLPKFSFHFYRSQQGKIPVLFPAIHSLQGKTKIPVYSNCQRVDVLCEGTVLASQTHDSGATVPFDEKKYKKTNDNYWMNGEDHIAVSKEVSDLGRHTMRCLFDGGNCEAIAFPPFTFDQLNVENKQQLSFVGYIDEKEVVRSEISQPGVPTKMEIEVANFDLPLRSDDNDFVFVYVHLYDAQNNPVYKDGYDVTLQVENGVTIGHTSMATRAGIAPFMVSANTGVAQLSITATCIGLESCTVTMTGLNEA